MFLKFPICIFLLLSCFLTWTSQEEQGEQKEQKEQEELNAKLIRAVINNNIGQVKKLLSAGANPNAKGKAELSDNAVLHTVKNSEITKLLLSAGADPNVKNKFGHTPLHVLENPEISRLLVKAGADVNVRNNEGETPSHTVRNPEIARIFVKAGADLNVKSNYGATPLHDLESPKMARIFIEAGADLNVRDNDGETPLHDLASYFPEIARIFVEAGADLNVRNNEEETPLHFVNEADFELAEFFIANGANPLAENNEGEYPSVVYKHPSLVKRPLQHPEEKETSCRYITESSQISTVQCGQRNVCMAEVSCGFKIGMTPNTAFIGRNFQVVCSSLSDGQCPKANDCVFDRSVVSAEKTQTVKPSNKTAAPQSSSGVR